MAEVVAGVVVPVNVLVVGVDIVLVIGATSTAIAAENLTCLPMSSAAVAVVNRKPICEDGAHSHIWRGKRGRMPRHKSLITVIRETVQNEVRSAVQGLLGGFGGQPMAKATNGRRKRRRGTWRPGGPGRPPKAVAVKAVSRTAKKAARKKQ